MPNQSKKTDHGVQPFGFIEHMMEKSDGIDQKVHPKRKVHGRLGEHTGERGVQPFSVGDLTRRKAGAIDQRARPHGDHDGASLQHGKSIQPFSVVELTSEKAGKVDRKIRPDD